VTHGTARFGKRASGCECTDRFTCRKCLDRAVERMKAERNVPPPKEAVK
jgi:hypothetical protein